MKPLEPTNLIMAAVSALLLIALFTPIADPARLSVASQVKRLESGKVEPDKFDFQFLRFESGRYGRDGLERLKASRDSEVARRAREAGVLDSRPTPQPAKPDFSRVTVYPAGAKLPDTFVNQAWGPDRRSDCINAGSVCKALLIDVDGDGADEVLLGVGNIFDVFQLKDGRWRRIAQTSSHCDTGDVEAALAAGQVSMAPAKPRRDLVAGGDALSLQPIDEGCPQSAPEDKKRAHSLTRVAPGPFSDAPF
jgi:hypothetical protein